MEFLTLSMVNRVVKAINGAAGDVKVNAEVLGDTEYQLANGQLLWPRAVVERALRTVYKDENIDIEDYLSRVKRVVRRPYVTRSAILKMLCRSNELTKWFISVLGDPDVQEGWSYAKVASSLNVYAVSPSYWVLSDDVQQGKVRFINHAVLNRMLGGGRKHDIELLLAVGVLPRYTHVVPYYKEGLWLYMGDTKEALDALVAKVSAHA